jgi:hypothetical protein
MFVKGLTNLRPGGLWGMLQQSACANQNATQTIAALACVLFDKGLLQWVSLACIAQTF